MGVDDCARDGFAGSGSPVSDAVTSQVQHLSLKEDSSLPLFDVHSLDSISSNSSGLSFAGSSHKSASGPSPRPNSQATPLVDEGPADVSSDRLLSGASPISVDGSVVSANASEREETGPATPEPHSPSSNSGDRDIQPPPPEPQSPCPVSDQKSSEENKADEDDHHQYKMKPFKEDDKDRDEGEGRGGATEGGGMPPSTTSGSSTITQPEGSPAPVEGSKSNKGQASASIFHRPANQPNVIIAPKDAIKSKFKSPSPLISKKKNSKTEIKNNYVPTAFENALLGKEYSKKLAVLKSNQTKSPIVSKTVNSPTVAMSSPVLNGEFKVPLPVKKTEPKKGNEIKSKKPSDQSTNSLNKSSEKYDKSDRTKSDGMEKKSDSKYDSRNGKLPPNKESSHKSSDKLVASKKSRELSSKSTKEISSKKASSGDKYSDSSKHLKNKSVSSISQKTNTDKNCSKDVQNRKGVESRKLSSDEQKKDAGILSNGVHEKNKTKTEALKKAKVINSGEQKENLSSESKKKASKESLDSELQNSVDRFKISPNECKKSKNLLKSTSDEETPKESLPNGKEDKASVEQSEKSLTEQKPNSRHKSTKRRLSSDSEESPKFLRTANGKKSKGISSLAVTSSDESFSDTSDSSSDSEEEVKKKVLAPEKRKSSFSDDCEPKKRKISGGQPRLLLSSSDESSSDEENPKPQSELNKLSKTKRSSLGSNNKRAMHTKGASNSRLYSSDEEIATNSKSYKNKQTKSDPPVTKNTSDHLPQLSSNGVETKRSKPAAIVPPMVSDDTSSSDDSFYETLLEEAKHKGKNHKTRKETIAGKSPQKVCAPRSPRKKNKYDNHRVIVSKEGVVVFNEFGQKILLSYDEKNDVCSKPPLFLEDSDHAEEFEGFSCPKPSDIKQSFTNNNNNNKQPKVILDELYDFTGFTNSNTAKKKKLFNYLEETKRKEEQELSFSVTSDMFNRDLPIKVFLDACIKLGAKVTGFHAFLVHSPRMSKSTSKISRDSSPEVKFDNSPENKENHEAFPVDDKETLATMPLLGKRDTITKSHELSPDSALLTPDDNDDQYGNKIC